ncbi:extracellular solute-binding protein [Amaricoccus tamworthensis]|uniref:extracellular solute-binding protein n=1 Tax=Amaricoccus tamworthensis TaxID=57002 RepID=UPI003C7C507C
MTYFRKAGTLALILGTTAGTSTLAETLTVYFNAGHAYHTYLEVIEQFEADNPGWEVALERYQWPDMRTKLVADFAGGTTPDLVAEPGGWVTEFAEQGHLTPLGDFIEQDSDYGFPEDWQDSSVAKNTLDGEIYAVQIHLTCATLLYNVDMLSEAGFDGPPTNWEEFREVAIATTGGGKYGFAPNPSIAYYFPWLYQNGADWYDADAHEMTFGSDAAMEAIQFVGDLIHKDRAAPPPIQGADYEGPQKLFTAGRAAMIITGPWDVRPIKEGNPDLNWAVAPSLTHKEQRTMQGGVSLMIPAEAEHPEMAWELTKRLTAVDVEVATALQYGMTMPRKSWLENEEIANDPILSAFGSCLPYSQGTTTEISRSGAPVSQLETIYLGAIDEVVYGGAQAADVMPAAEDEANQLLSQ